MRDSVGYRALKGAWAGLDDPKTVLWLIIGYCVVHWLVRLGLSPVYSVDEAEQMLFAQELSMGYRFRHPPLITWITWSVQQVFGLDRIAFFAMKYAIMAGGFVALFFAGRAILKDTRLAALATAAFTLTYTVGYYPHLDLMHTVLLTNMLGLGLYVLTRVLDHGRWQDYLLYGAVTALGILSKYVFGIFSVAAIIAVLMVPAFRTRISPVKALASLGLTMLLLAPYASWALGYEYSMVGLAQDMTEAETGGVDLGGWAQGIAMLAWSLVEFTLPFSLIFLALFWHRLRGPMDQTDPRMPYLKMLEIIMIAGTAMMLSAVFLAGATHFKGRWMHQVLMVLPIYLFLRLALSQAVGETSGRLKVYGGLVATVAVLVVGARIVAYETNDASCSKCWEYQPFEDYADGLRTQGFETGTILVSNMYVGGNLRAQFPEARVLIHGYPLSVFPEANGAGSCAIAWLKDDATIPGKLGPLRAKLGLAPLPEDHRRGRIRKRIGGSEGRWFTLNYVLMPDGPADCR